MNEPVFGMRPNTVAVAVDVGATLASTTVSLFHGSLGMREDANGYKVTAPSCHG